MLDLLKVRAPVTAEFCGPAANDQRAVAVIISVMIEIVIRYFGNMFFLSLFHSTEDAAEVIFCILMNKISQLL